MSGLFLKSLSSEIYLCHAPVNATEVIRLILTL